MMMPPPLAARPLLLMKLSVTWSLAVTPSGGANRMPAAAVSLPAVDGAVFHVQGGAIDEIDAGAAGSRSLKGEIAKPHDNAGAVDSDKEWTKGAKRSAAVDRDRLGDGQGRRR